MRFRHELPYAAPPADVFAMLSDPEFRSRVGEAVGVISAEVSLTPNGDGFSLVIDQQQPTEDLPGFARTFAGDSAHVVQREDWAGPDGGTIVIEAPGKPTDVRGTISLEPAGAGTREVVEMELKFKVPLIGGRLEKLMADRMRRGYETEQGVGEAWLAGAR